MTDKNGNYIQCWKLNDVLEILEKSDYSSKELKNLYVIKKSSIQKPPNPFEVLTFSNVDWR